MFTLNDQDVIAGTYMETESYVSLPILRDFIKKKTYTNIHTYIRLLSHYRILITNKFSIYHVPLKTYILFQFLMRGTQYIFMELKRHCDRMYLAGQKNPSLSCLCFSYQNTL